VSRKKLQLVLAALLVLLLITTVAYAYTGPDFGSRTLKYGMIGGDVQDLQNILNNKGYGIGYADGIFGWKTKTGVIKFQQDAGLTADAIVGLATFKALKNGSLPASTSQNKSLSQILKEKGISNTIPNLKIVVDKSEHSLTLYSGPTSLKSYHVALGDSGLGDKVRSGDHKTPNGTFYIAERSVLSPADQYLGTRWMRISYPNIEDAQRGLDSGLIDRATYNQIVQAINNGQIPPQHTALGGGVGIHGGSNWRENWGDAWTWGCVGLTNTNVNEIYEYIPVGTKLVIQY
jgi:murein L,D-transpeptidase YafK